MYCTVHHVRGSTGRKLRYLPDYGTTYLPCDIQSLATTTTIVIVPCAGSPFPFLPLRPTGISPSALPPEVPSKKASRWSVVLTISNVQYNIVPPVANGLAQLRVCCLHVKGTILQHGYSNTRYSTVNRLPNCVKSLS